VDEPTVGAARIERARRAVAARAPQRLGEDAEHVGARLERGELNKFVADGRLLRHPAAAVGQLEEDAATLDGDACVRVEHRALAHVLLGVAERAKARRERGALVQICRQLRVDLQALGEASEWRGEELLRLGDVRVQHDRMRDFKKTSVSGGELRHP
jgi:hypothetical protein